MPTQTIYTLFHIDNRYIAFCLSDKQAASSEEVREPRTASLWIEDHFVATSFMPFNREIMQ